MLVKHSRHKFSKYKKYIDLLSGAFSYTPKFILYFMWAATDNYKGNMSALLRYCIIKNLAESVGENVYIGPNVEIRNPQNLVIGNNVSIHRFCYIDALGGVTLGDHVAIAHNVSILTTNHTWTDPEVSIKYNKASFEPVVIEEDVWLGCGVRVLAGAHIESRVVVAANAVARGRLAGKQIYGGLPAKPIKSIA